MRKILLLLLCIFLITGCKVEYDLVINNDLTVLEEVDMTGTNEFFENYYKSTKINVINMVFDQDRQDILKKNGYSYKLNNGNTPYLSAKKTYNNLEQFAKNTVFFEQYFESVNVTQNEGIFSLKTGEFIPINPDSIDRYDIKISTIKIKTPYKVIEQNASSFDEKNNIYTWYIDDNTSEFSINFSFNTNEIYKLPNDNNSIVLIIATIILIVSLIVVYVINKKNFNM